MAQVRELFSELFAYVLLFEQTHLQAGAQPPYEQVRRDITTLLEQQKAAAKRQGMLEQDFQDACFAVIAWVDETILKLSTWQHHSTWNAFPLQQEYYQIRTAGEDLFERLERLRPDQQEVREVYYLCLGLGFNGQYFLGLEDELKLNQIRHEQARHLTRPVENVQDIDKIVSQPYEVQPPPPRPIRRPLTYLLPQIGLALLVIIPLVFFLLSKILPSSPPQLTVEAIQQRLSPLPPCVNITVGLQAGVVELRGRVMSEEQRANIRRTVQNIQGVTTVTDSALQMIPAPFCEVLDILEPINKQAADQGIGLVTQLNKPGNNPVYFGEESLIISGKAPAKFPSYLYVDYYTTDQMVAHLFPEKGIRESFEPSKAFTVGKPKDQPGAWIILPPFGLELVTVIASKVPLFAVPRSDSEPAGAYIKELRQVLSPRMAQADVAATYHIIITRPAGQ
jgi:type VI secretion system protein ImpK